MDKETKTSLMNSYLIGLPFGLGFIATTILLPSILTDEGILTMIMLVSFGKAIIGLIISFLISLWIGAIVAKNSIKKGDKLIYTSFKYSGIINIIIWTVFGVIASVNPESEFKSVWIALIACILCIIITTLSIGLIISYRIKLGLKNTKANNVS